MNPSWYKVAYVLFNMVATVTGVHSTCAVFLEVGELNPSLYKSVSLDSTDYTNLMGETTPVKLYMKVEGRTVVLGRS